jgi:8-oxo-dGTP diphosphatase
MTHREQTQRVGAYAVATDAGRILLVRLSAITPVPGHWSLPGGGVDFGEHPRDAVVREVYEETGLEARVEALLAVASAVRALPGSEEGAGDYHAIRIIYRVVVDPDLPLRVLDVGGSSDAARWVGLTEAAELPLSPTASMALDLIDVVGVVP